MLSFFLFLGVANTFALPLSDNESKRIGDLIFQNECASHIACLTSWNKGEDFASLGIGHFIWYPKGINDSNKRFDESFPKLLVWMQKRHIHIPKWLLHQHGSPWQSRKQFQAAKNTQNMKLLRNFLIKTRFYQIQFMQNRLKLALPRMLKHIPQEQYTHIQQQFMYVLASPMGFYALMDYVNFKGEGIKASERYKGKGWGLLQALKHMQSSQSGLNTIQDFVNSTAFVLTRRVRLSPPSRHEKRWLTGWKNRVKTYKLEARKDLSNQ